MKTALLEDGWPGLIAPCSSRGFLAAYVLPLVMNLLPDDDLDGAYRDGQAAVIAAIRAVLPASDASTNTIDALAGVVTDFPHPIHKAVLDIVATAPITPDAVWLSPGRWEPESQAPWCAEVPQRTWSRWPRTPSR